MLARAVVLDAFLLCLFFEPLFGQASDIPCFEFSSVRPSAFGP